MDVIVPRRDEDLLTMLAEGKGDLVAASYLHFQLIAGLGVLPFNGGQPDILFEQR